MSLFDAPDGKATPSPYFQTLSAIEKPYIINLRLFTLLPATQNNLKDGQVEIIREYT